jgi:putative ABC transport system permease protein
MPVLPRVRSVIRSLAGRGPVQQDLDRDVGGYFDMLVDEHMARGLSAGDARRQASLEMGGVEQVKELVRAVRPGRWLETVARDVRHGVRMLAKTPAFSLTAVLMLALGIGANAAVFSVIDILLLRPLPGADQPGEVLRVYSHDPAKADSYRSFSHAEYEAIRDQAGVFAHCAAYRSYRIGVTDGEVARHREAELVTGGYFETLGVRLAAGRGFSQEEVRPGSRAAVVILSDSFWHALGGGREILGRTIAVNSQPFTIVGVAPPGFSGTLAFAGPDFWMPLGAEDLLSGRPGDDLPAASSNRPSRNLKIVGRSKPNLTVEAADTAMRALSRGLEDGRSTEDAAHVLTVARLARTADSDQPSSDAGLAVPLGALTGAAVIVLIIASLNIANMQLARGTSRRKEIAMRLALGAGRGRIVGQLLIEALVLAVAGGMLGLVAGAWTVRAIVASLTPLVQQSLAVDITPDWRVWLASLASCTLAAVVFGLGPAWKLSRLDLAPEMKSQDGTRREGGLRRLGPTNLLVAGQIALSLALLAAAGLFVRGAVAAGLADPGYRFDRQLLVRVDASLGLPGGASGREAYRQAMERIRSMPGVESASIASVVAFGNGSNKRRVTRPGMASAAASERAQGAVTETYAVGAAYFQTLGLALLRGREFTLAEELGPASTSPAVIIDEPLAAALFPGQDALGQLVQLAAAVDDPAAATQPMQVVGVATGLRHRLSDRGPVPHLYVPLGTQYRDLLNIHVRSVAGGRAEMDDVRRRLGQAVRMTGSQLALLSVETLEEARDGTPRNWLVRTAGRTFGAFGAIALFMAAAGLYGVKSYLVARRTREIGIRVALGASAPDVIRMFLKEGSVLLGASIAIGFLLAVGVGQALSSLLVGVNAFDPLVLFGAAVVLSGAVLCACYVPARRATRVSPVVALRAE